MNRKHRRTVLLLAILMLLLSTGFRLLTGPKKLEECPDGWKDGGDVCYVGEGCPSWVCRDYGCTDWSCDENTVCQLEAGYCAEHKTRCTKYCIRYYRSDPIIYCCAISSYCSNYVPAVWGIGYGCGSTCLLYGWFEMPCDGACYLKK